MFFRPVILLLLFPGLLTSYLTGCKTKEGEPQANLSDTSWQTLSDTSSMEPSVDTATDGYHHIIVVGDIDGNNLSDTAMIFPPDKGCEEICTTRITFSSPSIPALIDSMSTGGVVTDVGDIDGNGTDDLLFLPDWPTSCWSGITLYGLHDSTWEVFGGASLYRCNDNPYEHPKTLADRVHRLEPGLFELTHDELDSETGELVQRQELFDIRSRFPTANKPQED